VYKIKCDKKKQNDKLASALGMHGIAYSQKDAGKPVRVREQDLAQATHIAIELDLEYTIKEMEDNCVSLKSVRIPFSE